MPKISVDGMDIFYEVQGDGQPLLLIAGFACDHTNWFKVSHALASRYRVIVFDNRGVGQSSSIDTAVSIRQLAADAAGLVDAMGLGPVHLAGHSMGGMIAQELALAQPEKVKSLVLLSTCAQVDERGRAIIESWGELPRRLDAATATRLVLPWIYTSAFFAKPGAIEQVIEQIVANPFPPSEQAIYNQSRALSTHNTADRLSAFDCPTLVVVGREDILVPVAFSEQLVRGIRGAELVVLEQTGHGLLIESPDEVANAMLKFLSQHRS
jgi:3-oxoadipate enol-lactonase